MSRAVTSNPWVRFLAFLVGLFLIMWMVYELRDIFVPFALALIAAYVLDPVVCVLQRIGLPRWVAIVLMVFLVLAAVAVVLIITIPLISEEITEGVPHLVEGSKRLAARFQQSEFLDSIRVRAEALLEGKSLEEWLALKVGGLLENRMKDILVSGGKLLRGTLTGTIGLIMYIFQLVLFFVVFIYFLKDINALKSWAKGLIPEKSKDNVLRVASSIDQNMRAFFRGQLIVAIILAVLYSVGLSIVGVPFGVMIGTISGAANIVPYLGVAIGLIPSLIMVALATQHWFQFVGVILVFSFAQTVEGTILTPKIVGDRVRLHPVAIILALMVFGKLLGFFGMLFAVPIASVIKVAFNEFLRRHAKAGEATT